jgi:hypothetical protein
MIAARRSIVIACLLTLGGCASGDLLEGQRTVFNNPFVAPVIDQRGIGPQCDRGRGNDTTCLGVPLARDGRAFVHPRSYTDAQERVLRERAALLQERIEQLRTPPPPAPPTPSAPPIAEAPAEPATE